MKAKKHILLYLIVLLYLFSSTVYAHPGRTDENGGHFDKRTGEYHYHHGYSAHQHENGECPYDFVDNRDTQSNVIKATELVATTRKKNAADDRDDKISLYALLVAGLFFSGLYIKDKYL